MWVDDDLVQMRRCQPSQSITVRLGEDSVSASPLNIIAADLCFQAHTVASAQRMQARRATEASGGQEVRLCRNLLDPKLRSWVLEEWSTLKFSSDSMISGTPSFGTRTSCTATLARHAAMT